MPNISVVIVLQIAFVSCKSWYYEVSMMEKFYTVSTITFNDVIYQR